MNKRTRQFIGLLIAVVLYYLIHEGAHFLSALLFGAFRQINIAGIGIQVDVWRKRMSDAQLGWFCLAGPLATLVFGSLFVIAAKRICGMNSRLLRAVSWYTTMALLLIDPIYLGILCGFVGGGDMNGIRLICSETVVRVLWGLIGLINAGILMRYLYPLYSASFVQNKDRGR